MSAASSGAPIITRSISGHCGRFERRADQQQHRQVDDREADAAAPRPGRAGGATSTTSASASTQARRLQPITGPRRVETTAIRAPRVSIAAGSTDPSVRIACPVIWSGTASAEEFEDRRGDVGRGDVAVRAGGVGGEVAVEAAAGDPDRDRLVGLPGRRGDRDHEAARAQERRGLGGLAEPGFLDIEESARFADRRRRSACRIPDRRAGRRPRLRRRRRRRFARRLDQAGRVRFRPAPIRPVRRFLEPGSARARRGGSGGSSWS